MSRNNEARRKEIEVILTNQHIVSVQVLSDLLHVSNETIRKDLAFLEDKGILYRTHGGARERAGNVDIPYDIRSQEHTMEKRRIAREVLPFIHDDDVLYIDNGSTAAYLGTLLKTKKNLTLVTNSIELLTSLQDTSHTIILTGGTYNKDGKRVSGELALSILDTLYFDVCVLGMDGCKGLDGPALMENDEWIMNQHILKRSHKAILLSDATKLSKHAHYQYADFSQFDIFITTQLTAAQRDAVAIPMIIETEKGETL